MRDEVRQSQRPPLTSLIPHPSSLIPHPSSAPPLVPRSTSATIRDMRFSELPVRLRAYILAHALVLAPVVAALLWQPLGRAHLTDLCLLLLFTIVFSTWKVELTVFQGRMTLAFAVVSLAQLLPFRHPLP